MVVTLRPGRNISPRNHMGLAALVDFQHHGTNSTHWAYVRAGNILLSDQTDGRVSKLIPCIDSGIPKDKKFPISKLQCSLTTYAYRLNGTFLIGLKTVT